MADQKKQQSENMPAQQTQTWIEQQEVYLQSHGWEKKGGNERGVSIWADPLGTLCRAEPTTLVDLTPKGQQEKVIVRQMTGQPTPWDYVFDEALMVQRGRDSGGGSLEQRITIKRKELGELEAELKKRGPLIPDAGPPKQVHAA